MGATVKDIVTLNEVKRYMKIAEGNNEFNSIMESSGSDQGFIELISDAVEHYLKNKVAKQTITDLIVDGNGTNILPLPYWPVKNVESVGNIQYRTTISGGWTNLFDSAADFNSYLYVTPQAEFNIGAGVDQLEILESLKTFPLGRKNIKITYDAGWDPIPGDLKKVVLEMIATMYKESDQKEGRLGMQSKSKTGGSIGGTVADTFFDMDPKWKRVLNRYRVPTI